MLLEKLHTMHTAGKENIFWKFTITCELEIKKYIAQKPLIISHIVYEINKK